MGQRPGLELGNGTAANPTPGPSSDAELAIMPGDRLGSRDSPE